MPLTGHSFFPAEREGFEPPDLLQSTVFKTAAIDRSAISPRQMYIPILNFKKKSQIRPKGLIQPAFQRLAI